MLVAVLAAAAGGQMIHEVHGQVVQCLEGAGLGGVGVFGALTARAAIFGGISVRMSVGWAILAPSSMLLLSCGSLS